MAILNALLQPTDAPVTSERGTVGYLWDTTSDRGMVRNMQIQDFTFDKGQGGTLTLGGTANGNGYFQINNSLGSAMIVANNTGITVNDGSIRINNTSGSSTVDGTGVVSVNNFGNAVISQAAGFNQNITGTTDVPFTSGTLNVIVSRNTNVLFLADYNTYWSTGTAYGMSHNAIVKIKVDNVQQGGGIDQMRFASPVGGGTVTATFNIDLTNHSVHTVQTLTAGTHPFVLTGAIGSLSGSLGTLTIYQYRMTYIQLGT